MTTVWVTRTQPGATATGARVEAAGFDAFVAPLLEVVFEPGGEIDLSGVTALAFTSANGVRAFAARSISRNLPVYAVGRGTAAAAREAGFNTVHDGNGDVFALADTAPSGETFLLPGAAEPAADLASVLAARGVAARNLIVYSTVPAAITEAERGQAAACGFVLLQSAKAARAYRDLQLVGPKPICLSEAVCRALGGSMGILACAPTEAALMAALIEAAG